MHPKKRQIILFIHLNEFGNLLLFVRQLHRKLCVIFDLACFGDDQPFTSHHRPQRLHAIALINLHSALARVLDDGTVIKKRVTVQFLERHLHSTPILRLIKAAKRLFKDRTIWATLIFCEQRSSPSATCPCRDERHDSHSF